MAIGIVAEFNPFHNGHKYLISQAKRLTGETAAVAVMSGEWVQRGESAITDKWSRAEMALRGGIDLVLELPVTFSLNSAREFARGAISVLNAAGIVTTLSFGSECGDSNALNSAAEALLNEPEQVSEAIKKLVSSGESFAAARCEAYSGIIPKNILSEPNDILALEYLRAAKEMGAKLNICAIKRGGAGHDSDIASGDIASASYIRSLLLEGESAKRYMPDFNFPIYSPSALDTAVIARFRAGDAEYLKNISGISEGLENRFIKSAMTAQTAAELCELVKSKRYAHSRLRRAAYAALLGITKKEAALPPSYIRVLGMNTAGKALLKEMKSASSLPIVIKAADFAGDKLFNICSRAEDIFALCAPLPQLKRGGRNLSRTPVIIE